MADPQWWPVDNLSISGDWAANPVWYQQNTGLLAHNGIDFVGPLNTPIYASDDGVIHQEGWNIPWSGAAGGIAIIIRHAYGYTGYAHLNSTIIDAGQHVARGQLIGYMGATGFVTGVHLHYEALPPSINFANGYSGRVNPRALMNLQPRGTVHGGGSSGGNTPSRNGDNNVLHRDQDGSIYQADDWGYDSILDFGGGMAISELIYAAESLNGAAVQVNNRQRDLLNSYARNRWNKKRAQIVGDLVQALGPNAKVDVKAIADALAPVATQAALSAVRQGLDEGVKIDVDEEEIAKTVISKLGSLLKGASN